SAQASAAANSESPASLRCAAPGVRPELPRHARRLSAAIPADAAVASESDAPHRSRGPGLQAPAPAPTWRAVAAARRGPGPAPRSNAPRARCHGSRLETASAVELAF